MKRILVLILLLFQYTATADVTVITYNMAQLKRTGFDLVACTKRRVALQVDAMFKDPASPVFSEKDFVLLIQESWTKRSFKALKAIADERGYTIFPDQHKLVKDNGQLIITNLRVQELKSIPFSQDRYAKKGMIYARFVLSNEKTIGVVNVHTGFSNKVKFSDEHRKQFSEIAEATSVYKETTDYFVIGGDFNAGPDMKFKTENYDAANAIWEEGFMSLLRPLGMRLLDSVGPTWDETNNNLVKIPPLLLRVFNKLNQGYIGWDMQDSTLDHILVPENSTVSRHELAFHKKVPLNCGKRDDEDGLLHLSDHYGVMAVIKTNSL